MDTFKSGVITVGTAATQATAANGGPPKNVNGVVYRAMSGNVGKIYVKDDNTVAATNAYELAAGESLPIEMVNPGKLFFKGTDAGDKVCWASVSA